MKAFTWTLTPGYSQARSVRQTSAGGWETDTHQPVPRLTTYTIPVIVFLLHMVQGQATGPATHVVT